MSLPKLVFNRYKDGWYSGYGVYSFKITSNRGPSGGYSIWRGNIATGQKKIKIGIRNTYREAVSFAEANANPSRKNPWARFTVPSHKVKEWRSKKTGRFEKRQASKNPVWIPTKDKSGKKEARRVPTWSEHQTPGLVESESFFSPNPKSRSLSGRGAIVIAPKVVEICTDRKKYFIKGAALLLGLPDGSILVRGYKGPKIEGVLRYILYEDTLKAAREGQALDKPWRHDVKSAVSAHLTGQGLLITSKQAPLWGIQ